MIVSKQKQEDVAGHYTIKLNFPSLEGSNDSRFQLFNTEVDTVVAQVSQDFKNNVQQIDSTPAPNLTGSYLSMDYSVKFGERGLLSVLFTVDFYMAGAAHPNQYFVTLNLDVARGKVLALKDLFKPGASYLKFVSDFAIQDLTRQARLDWDTGATPTEENFRSWNVTSGGLLLPGDRLRLGTPGGYNTLCQYERHFGSARAAGTLPSIKRN